MQLTYLGHSGFMLEADGQDRADRPVGDRQSGRYGEGGRSRRDDDPPLPRARRPRHRGRLAISKRTGATIISTFELGEWLGAQGANANPGNHGGTLAFDGGSVKLTPAWHTSSYQTGRIPSSRRASRRGS